MNLKIEYVKKEDLKPYVNNAKLHPTEQVEQIKNSIREFGFNDPIAVWGENEIVEGHGWLLAAMEMNELETVPIIRLDHLNDKQRKAYMIAHNKLTMNSDFNIDLLSLEFEDLIGSFDMTNFGFNEAEILELTIDDNTSSVPYGESYPTNYYSENKEDGGNERNPVDNSFYGNQNQEEYEKAFKEELNQYEERANNSTLVSKRVILIYRTEEEMNFLKNILRIKPENDLNVVYNIHDIMGVKNAESTE